MLLNFIKKYYGIVILLLGLSFYFGRSYFNDLKVYKYFSNPVSQDLYIFQFDTIFAPYLLDYIKDDSFYFYAHPYDFKNNIPDCNLILEDSFRKEMYYIYSKEALEDMMRSSKIAKIYRKCQ